MVPPMPVRDVACMTLLVLLKIIRSGEILVIANVCGDYGCSSVGARNLHGPHCGKEGKDTCSAVACACDIEQSAQSVWRDIEGIDTQLDLSACIHLGNVQLLCSLTANARYSTFALLMSLEIVVIPQGARAHRALQVIVISSIHCFAK